MVIKTIHFSAKAVSLASIISALLLISLFVWIITGPRSLSSITPYVEKELSDISDNFNVKIDESYIAWDGLQKAFTIEVTGVRLYNDTDNSIATFPKATFDFSIMNLVRGHILSSDLTLVNPVFYVDASHKALYVKPKSSMETAQSFVTIISNILISNNHKSPINSIQVKDADLFINNGMSDLVWHVSDGYARIDTTNPLPKIISELTVNIGDVQTYLGVEAERAYSGILNTKLTFRNMPSYIVNDILPQLDVLKKLDVVASGSLDFLIDGKSDVSQMQFQLDSLKGTADVSTYFKKKMTIDSLTAEGNLYENFTTLAIDKLTAQLGETTLSLDGTIRNSGSWEDIAPDINAQVSVKNFKVSELDNFWPLGLHEKTREWIVEHVTGGNVTEAKGKFIFSHDDIKHIEEWNASQEEQQQTPLPATAAVFPAMPPPVPDNAIQAEIHVTDTNVHYAENYPDVTNVDAVVSFTANSLKVESTKATIGQTLINRASVKMRNMWQRPIILVVEGEYAGIVEDAAAFLKAGFQHSEPSAILSSLYQSTGKIGGTASITLPIKKDLTFDDINLAIAAHAIETKIPAFMHGHDFEGVTFDLAMADNKVNVVGDGTLNGSKLKAEYNFDIPTKTASYHVIGDVSAQYLKDMELATIPLIENNFGIDVTLESKDGTKTIKGTADITAAKVAIPKVGFEKPAGAKGQIKFSATQTDSGLITSFDAKGDGFTAIGSMTIVKSTITSLLLKNVTYNRNAFNANYSTTANDIKMTMDGQAFDLSSIKLGDLFDSKEENKKKIDIDAKLDTVYMKNDEAFKQFDAHIKCTPGLCNSMNLYAKTREDGYIALSMKPLGDRSSLMVESDNAGAVISAFGISEHIEKGSLSIESTFSKTNGHTVAQGMVHLWNFTAIKTPTLGKLLTLASFKGITDLLDNKGIQFEKFEAPFTMMNGIITVKDAKSSGSSIGLTSNGTINLNEHTIDLDGVVVPANTVNQALSKIPVVGNLIIGGENEGIIATKYKIEGPYEEAKISVNPLTILTPGFLRNIFDILPGK